MINEEKNNTNLTLKGKTAKGLFWGGVSNGIQQLLGVVFGIFLARILNAEDYGLVGMLAIFSGIGSTIINSGFSVALTNNKNVTHKDYNAVFWFTFFVGLAIYLILFFCSQLIADFFNRPELVSLSRVLFISLFFGGIGVVPYTILFKKIMVKEQAKIDITAMALSGIVGVFLAIKGFAYWALALQSVTYVVSGSILRYIIAPWRPTLNIDFKPLKGMLNFSIKLFLTTIFQHINANIFSILLGRYYNATQLGYYAQGYKWMGMGNQIISGMINMVAQPVMVQVNSDRERETRVFRKMLRFGAFVAFPAFVGLAYISKEFILIFIGEKWLPSILYLQILCGWGIISTFVTLFTQLLISHAKSNIYLWGNLLTGIFQIMIIILLYKINGDILYMVIGYVLVYLGSMFFWHFYAKKLISITIMDLMKDIIPYFIISLSAWSLSLLLIYYINNVYMILITKVVSMGAIYLFILWLLGSKMLKDSVKLLKR